MSTNQFSRVSLRDGRVWRMRDKQVQGSYEQTEDSIM